MPGDYIIFDEAGHRKLLKEYFINEKVPRSVREELPLVCDGSHVMWIVGYRMSAAYKADRTTKRILVVTVRRNRDGIRDKSSD
jgi:tRNA(Ile)-lysidine synthase